MGNENKILSDEMMNETGGDNASKAVQEKRCPSCQALLKEEQIFCPECGTPSRKFCVNCQTELQEDQAFCPQCGLGTSEKQDAIEQYNLNLTKNTGKKNNIFRTLFIITLVVVIGVSCGMGKVVYDLNKQLELKQKKISSQTSEIESLNSEIESLSSEIEELEDMSDFFDRHIKFISDDGTNYYHKYSCSRFEGDFWAYNSNAVPSRYRPCPYCH